MQRRRRNHTASAVGADEGKAKATAATTGRNRRQATSIQAQQGDCEVIEIEDDEKDVPRTRRNVKKSVEDLPAPVPVPKGNIHKQRCSNDENNDPLNSDTNSSTSTVNPGLGGSGKGKNNQTVPDDIADQEGENMLEQYSQLNKSRECEFMIYFVMADSSNEATCSSRLSMAHQLCTERNLATEWITENDCLAKNPTRANIFVMDPFEGPVYEHLLKHFYHLNGTFRIIGPQCLRQAFERNRLNLKNWGVPNRSHPMFTLGMSDVIITLSGFRDKERKRKLLDLIQKMAGFYTSSFTMAVTHVLAENVLSAKCVQAYKTGIPVMRADWVEAIWKESLNDISKATDSNFTRFICPIFHNIKICCSQLDAPKKESLVKIIQSNGGSYSSQLVKEQTQVLIIEHGQGEKFRYAKMWGLLCLKPEWITDSKRVGHVVVPDKYVVHFRKQDHNFVSTQIESRLNVPLEDISVSAIMNDVSLCNQSNFTNNCRSSITSTATASAIPNQVSRNPENDIEAIIESIGDNQFLDGCRIYLSGPASGPYEQIKKLLNVCGATRLDRLNENVSHVVVLGSNLLEHEDQALKTLHPRPFTVTVDWLFASSRKGELADEDEFLCVDSRTGSQARNPAIDPSKAIVPEKSQAIRTPSREGSSENTEPSLIVGEGFENEEDEVDEVGIPDELDKREEEEPAGAVGEGFEENEDDNFNVQDIEEVPEMQPPEKSTSSNSKSKTLKGSSKDDQVPTLQEPDPDEENQDGQTVDTMHPYVTTTSSQGPSQNMTKIFSDYHFDVLLQSSEENAEIKKSIRSMGGSISKEADIVILPPVYTVDRAKAPHQQRTKFWVLSCHDAKSPNIQHEFYHVPLKAFTGMEKLLADVCIAVSGYASYEKKYIEGVATALGARFQDVFAKKSSTKNNVTVFATTHLICNVSNNEKCQAATKWNVPIVRHEWITECFHAAQKLDIDCFRTDMQDKTETKASMFWETPKANKATSVIPATMKQLEKFKHPLPMPTARISFTTDENTLGADRKENTSSDAGFKTPQARADASPHFKGMSHTGSRQFKAALDRMAEDSPSPDMSAVCIRLPRTSTPEGDQYREMWATFKKRFPGTIPIRAEEQPAKNQSACPPMNARQEEVARNIEDSSAARNGLKRSSDPESGNEQQQCDNVSGEARITKRAKTDDTLQRIMAEELESEAGAPAGSTGSKLARRERRVIDSQLPLPPDVAPETAAVDSGNSKVYWDENKERPVDTHKRVEAESQASGESGEVIEVAKNPTKTKVSDKSKAVTSKGRKRSPIVYTFLLTGFSDDSETGKFTKIISGLGGNIIQSSKVEDGVDALIAKKFARSEKVLSAIAAGKPLLPCSYVLDSEKAGQLLNINEYVLRPNDNNSKNGNSSISIEAQVIQASYFWYMKIKANPNSKPFSDICAIIIEATTSKCNSYKNLIRIGGGTVWENGSAEVPNLIIGDEAYVKKKAKLPKAFSTLPIQPALHLNNVILKCQAGSSSA